jgi:5-methylcytosine-specific restriction endonuclease McrA
MDTREKRKAFYNSKAWLEFRAVQLRREPLCKHCLAAGRVTPATEVDHVVPLAKGGDPFGETQNLCRTCHQLKTNAEKSGKPQEVRGCDVHGIPLDPNHPWNREGTS